ncbi:hypothetical protein D9M71_765430 [compost metagenome]
MMLPVRFSATAVIIEPVKPDRLPMALIMPMPAAAATPDSTVPGRVQKIGIRLRIPEAAMLRKNTDSTRLSAKKALRIRPTPPMNAGIAACMRRSPVRLEWRALSSMATTATA